MSHPKIILLIDNVNMGLGHPGLTALARKFKKDPATLKDGELLMFLNRKRDKLKMMGHQGIVLGYLRMPKGRQIMLEAIQYLPKAFGAQGEINYDRALHTVLSDRLAKKHLPKSVSPLQAYRAMERSGLTARTSTT
jgi:hypothetical protein